MFDRIRGYKEHFLTPIGYRKISQILNGEGLKTPRGSVFKNNHVHSIYKKGLIREERINREDIVEVKDFKVQRIENPTKEFIESKTGVRFDLVVDKKLQEKGFKLSAPDVVQTLSVDELKKIVPQHEGWIIGDDPVDAHFCHAYDVAH